jgi:GAF domain-containing protein
MHLENREEVPSGLAFNTETDYRLRQQEVLSEFGVAALRTRDLEKLLDIAVMLCAKGMQTKFCKIARYIPAENSLFACAGVGWKPGVIGSFLIADLDNPAGYAVHTGEPIISDHLTNTARFRTPKILADHGIKRAINVVIRQQEIPWGILEVDSPRSDRFTGADLVFLQGFAHMLSVAIDRLTN